MVQEDNAAKTNITAQPPRASLIQNLTTQSLLLTHLFTLLASPQTPQTPPQISQMYAALQMSALDLSNLVKQVGEHQEIWNRLVEKRKEVEGLERQVRTTIFRLEEGRGALEAMVELGEKQLEGIEKSEQDSMSATTIMALGRTLARHSSAPVSSLITPVDRAQYEPWPTEAKMRNGLLFQLGGGSMSGRGERGVVGLEQAITAKLDERPPQIEQQEESGRRYDPNAVFQLDLNSDDSDGD